MSMIGLSLSDTEIDQLDAVSLRKKPYELLLYIKEKIGVDHITYHNPTLNGATDIYPYLVTTYSPSWVQRYRFKKYMYIDPLVELASKSILPVDWSRVQHQSKLVQDFFGEAVEFGVGNHGISVPVRGPTAGSSWALFTASVAMKDAEWRAFRPQLMRDLMVAATFFHYRIIEIEEQGASFPLESPTKREIDILRCAAEGLTVEETGRRLRIAATTVRTHLDSIRHKLGAINKTHAVAIAIRASII